MNLLPDLKKGVIHRCNNSVIRRLLSVCYVLDTGQAGRCRLDLNGSRFEAGVRKDICITLFIATTIAIAKIWGAVTSLVSVQSNYVVLQIKNSGSTKTEKVYGRMFYFTNAATSR
jgi:hypothetical protein